MRPPCHRRHAGTPRGGGGMNGSGHSCSTSDYGMDVAPMPRPVPTCPPARIPHQNESWAARGVYDGPALITFCLVALQETKEHQVRVPCTRRYPLPCTRSCRALLDPRAAQTNASYICRGTWMETLHAPQHATLSAHEYRTASGMLLLPFTPAPSLRRYWWPCNRTGRSRMELPRRANAVDRWGCRAGWHHVD